MKSDILSFICDKHTFFQNTFPKNYEEYKTAVDIGLPLMLVNKLLIEKKEKILEIKLKSNFSNDKRIPKELLSSLTIVRN